MTFRNYLYKKKKKKTQERRKIVINLAFVNGVKFTKTIRGSLVWVNIKVGRGTWEDSSFEIFIG